MFAENYTFYLKFAATKIEIHLITIWRFLRQKFKVFPHKLQMLSQIRDDNKAKKKIFVQNCRN